jgi:hypothetical protein
MKQPFHWLLLSFGEGLKKHVKVSPFEGDLEGAIAPNDTWKILLGGYKPMLSASA